MSDLLPDRHPNKDFFILDVSDASPKDDLASMEHPVFSLSVKPDMRELRYEHNGNNLKIIPSGRGLATIMDKDILLYCISKLVHQLNTGNAIDQWVELSAHEVMVATNWNTGKRDYERFEEALIRLKGTQIITDIATGDTMQSRGFGLIDEWEIIRKDEQGEEGPFGRMTRVRIKVSDWTYNAVNGMEVLTINSQYFRLRRPLERRIYELARKHMGDGDKPFPIGIEKLQKKVGSNSPPKKFRFFIKQIMQDDNIPDYSITLNGKTVTFSKKKAKPRALQSQFDFGGTAHLQVSPDVFEKARRAAPGYDIQGLYHEWLDFARDKEPPRNPNAAFIGFCKKRHAEKPVW